MAQLTATERFHTKYVVSESGCWLWQMYIRPNGYGRFCVDYHESYAHRWSYATFVGPIPEGMEVDHLCKVRHCVNPEHLEAVTRRENIERSDGVSVIHSRKTHCPQGHPYAGANLRVDGGSRKCVACRRARDAKYRRRKREASDGLRPPAGAA